MNTNAWTGQISAPFVVVLGLVICFFGYRLLKFILGVVGFIAGASAGWAFGLSWAPDNTVLTIISAIVGGAIGAALCVWLYFLGVFLLGASAGAIAAAALFSTSGNPPQPLLLVICAMILGVLAVVLQKLMIIASTAFTGSYLIIAGISQLLTGAHSIAPLWFSHVQPGMPGILTLFFWLGLGVVGMNLQYRASRKTDEAARQEAKRG